MTSCRCLLVLWMKALLKSGNLTPCYLGSIQDSGDVSTHPPLPSNPNSLGPNPALLLPLSVLWMQFIRVFPPALSLRLIGFASRRMEECLKAKKSLNELYSYVRIFLMWTLNSETSSGHDVSLSLSRESILGDPGWERRGTGAGGGGGYLTRPPHDRPLGLRGWRDSY